MSHIRRPRPGVGLLAALAALVVLAGCANSTSSEELRALIEQQPATSADVIPAAGADPDATDSVVGEPSSPVIDTDDAPAAAEGSGQPAIATGASRPSADSPARGQQAGNGKVATAKDLPAAGAVKAKAKAKAKGPAACNGEPMIIGTAGTQSGILGDAYRPGLKAVSAWVAAVNAAGGINCHKVKHIVADDGGDPARHQALVRRLVEQDKVIAFVYMDAPLTAPASKAYLNEKAVPVIGQEGGTEMFYDSPVHFAPFSSGTALMRLTAAAGARVTIPEGKKKLGVLVCQEAEFCSLASKVFPAEGKALGYDVVYNATGSITQPNFTAQCLAMRSAKADVVIGALDPASFHRLAGDCAKLGYTPTLVVSSVQSEDSYKDNPHLAGTVVGMNGLPWFLDSLPAIAEYQLAITKYAPGQTFGAGGINGWVSAKALEKAASAIGPDQTPSAAGVLSGLKAFKKETLGGLTFPLDFSGPAPRPKTACGWAVIVGKGTFTGSPKMFCASPAAK